MDETNIYIIIRRKPASGLLAPSAQPYRHTDMTAAIAEAKRLARENPENEFVIFKAIGKAVYQPVTVTMMADPDLELPF